VGFALVFYPVTTIAALTGATLVNVTYETLRNPVVVSEEASGSYGAPSWANIAIQGHAIGLIAGILAAVWLVRRRRRRETTEWIDPESRTSALVAFGAILLFGGHAGSGQSTGTSGVSDTNCTARSGSACSRSSQRSSRSRSPGATSRSGRIWRFRSRRRSETVSVCDARGNWPPAARFGTSDRGRAGNRPESGRRRRRRTPGDPIEVSGYQVTYAENVEDRVVSVVEMEAFGRSTSVNTSGVIVANADREIWTTAVSKGNLAFWGYRAVDVGGTGWRETVWVQRTGWVAANGGPTYRVDAVRNETRSTLFTSEPARAEPRIDGRNVTVAAVEGGFELRVEGDGGETEIAPLPAVNESVTLREVTFVRENNAVFAERRETRVRIAQRERYEGRQ